MVSNHLNSGSIPSCIACLRTPVGGNVGQNPILECPPIRTLIQILYCWIYQAQYRSRAVPEFGEQPSKFRSHPIMHCLFTYTGGGERGPESYFRVPPNQNTSDPPGFFGISKYTMHTSCPASEPCAAKIIGGAAGQLSGCYAVAALPHRTPSVGLELSSRPCIRPP